MKIKILQPTQHDAATHGAGDICDIPTVAAEALIACGSAEVADKSAKVGKYVPPVVDAETPAE